MFDLVNNNRIISQPSAVRRNNFYCTHSFLLSPNMGHSINVPDNYGYAILGCAVLPVSPRAPF